MTWLDMSGIEQEAYAFLMAYHFDTDATAEAVRTPVSFGKNWQLPQIEFEGMFANAKEMMKVLDKATIKELVKNYTWILAA